MAAPSIGMPPALRAWLNWKEAKISVPAFTLFLLMVLVSASAGMNVTLPIGAWLGAFVIALAYRLWVRLAGLRGLLAEGLGLEDLQRGSQELAREQVEAEAILPGQAHRPTPRSGRSCWSASPC